MCFVVACACLRAPVKMALVGGNQAALGSSVDSLTLIYRGRTLADDEPLAALELSCGTMVHVVLRRVKSPTPPFCPPLTLQVRLSPRCFHHS